MPFAAALSTTPRTRSAVEETISVVRGQLDGAPDLAVVFFSPHHTDDVEVLAESIQAALAPRVLVGCSGEAIVGGAREIEQQPAVVLWAARFVPSVVLEPFHLTLEQTAEGQSILGWPDALLESGASQSALLLLGDPYTFPVDVFLRELNEEHRGLRVVGGMCSGARRPGGSLLFLGSDVHRQGAVGVWLGGPVSLRTVVSQGCRPIGRRFVVTKSRDNIVLELGGKPPLEQLQQLWGELPARDQQLFQQGLHLGVAMNEYRSDFQRGDFLVRNVLGLDRESGAMAVTDLVRVGQTVQFHVRDAETADEDLRALLRMNASAQARRPAAALLFSCNGRGTRLFDQPHHDARTIHAELGPLPLAGFFAAGELGPVGDRNFIHGFTASVALFEE
jgi:small ligand-binding sensory domain FIST